MQMNSVSVAARADPPRLALVFLRPSHPKRTFPSAVFRMPQPSQPKETGMLPASMDDVLTPFMV